MEAPGKDHTHPASSGNPPEARPPPWKRLKPGHAAPALLAVLAALFVAYGLYWSVLETEFRQGVKEWVALGQAKGYRISYSAVRVGGFPGHLEAVISDPAIANFSGPRPWSWRGPALVFRARPWRLTRFRVSAPGRHWLMAVLGGRPTELTIDAPSLWLKVKVRGGRPQRVMLSARGVVIGNAGKAEVARFAAADVIIERPRESAAKVGMGEAALDLLVDVDDVGYRLEPLPGLGRTTERLRLRTSVTGELPENLGPQAIARWRDGGGTLEVRHLDVRHGPLEVEGDGTLALDGDLQPIGAFTLQVRGFGEALDRLRTAGLIKPESATVARMVLEAMTRKQGGEAGARLKVPLSIQDRRLYVGPVALLKVPAIDWE